jgi:hypothetical protein
MGKDPLSDTELGGDVLQTYLFRAANYLIHLDSDQTGTPILKQACDWFAERGVRDITCEK